MKIYLLPTEELTLIPEEYCSRHFPTRYERSKQFRNPNDALRCIGAGALISAILKADETALTYGPNGKPLLADGSAQFSISHSGGYAALAKDNCEIGADIEYIRERIPTVAKRVFSAEERDWIGESDERFYTLWTLKESVMKATGDGLQLNPSSFDIMPAIEGRSISIGEKDLYCAYTVFDGHAISLCSPNPINRVEPVILKISDIITP